MSTLQRLAVGYFALVLLAAAWAVYLDASLLHSVREHLLPDILLAALALPSSSSLGWVYGRWPVFFSHPFTQVGWCLLCGDFQAGLLFLLGGYVRRARAEA